MWLAKPSISEAESTVLQRFVVGISSLIPLVAIVLFFEIEDEPLLKYCCIMAVASGYVIKGYQKVNSNSGRQHQAVSSRLTRNN